jgi:4-amino-4-deoxy-L-arabinose transferase-like glycosyltransferase
VSETPSDPKRDPSPVPDSGAPDPASGAQAGDAAAAPPGAQDEAAEQDETTKQTPSPAAHDRAPPPSRRAWAERVSWAFALGVLGYFAIQALLRIAAGGGLGLDEAEQLVMGQSLPAGYGPQPPLYTWLYIALTGLLGEGVAALAVLKYGLLALTLLLTYRLCRQLFAQPWPAAVAALSILFLPQLVWEAQRALTHSVIALASVALACTLFLDVVRRGRLHDYLGFGVALAACALSKHNALFLPAGLVLAGLLLSGARAAILDRCFAYALAVAGVLVLPNLLWMAGHAESVLARSDKFALVAETGPLDSLTAVLRALVSFAALPAVLLALVALLPERLSPERLLPARYLPARLRGGGSGETPDGWRVEVDPALRRLLTLALGLAALAVLVLVLGASADSLKDRWLAPVLFPAVPVALAWLAPLLTPGRLRLAGLAALLLAAGCLLGLWARFLVPLDWRAPFHSEAPYDRLAESFPATGTLLTTDHWLGGNLRLQRPGLIVATPEYRGALPEALPVPLLLAWPAKLGPELPQELAALYLEAAGRPAPHQEGVELEARYPGSEETLAIYKLVAAE